MTSGVSQECSSNECRKTKSQAFSGALDWWNQIGVTANKGGLQARRKSPLTLNHALGLATELEARIPHFIGNSTLSILSEKYHNGVFFIRMLDH